ncbi:MAG: hypothetical protein M0P50_14620 [Bacteroidales bacterium]|jgi:hypothetical protein|nr:hypothetical protein [Bacteroidales bacterium]
MPKQTKPIPAYLPKPRKVGKNLNEDLRKIIEVTDGQNEALKIIINHNSKKHTDEK